MGNRSPSTEILEVIMATTKSSFINIKIGDKVYFYSDLVDTGEVYWEVKEKNINSSSEALFVSVNENGTVNSGIWIDYKSVYRTMPIR